MKDEPVAVAVAIVRRGDDILVTRRPAGVHLERLWEFPGGKVETGESVEECARREVLEETGLAVEITTHLETLTHRYPDRTVILHFLECHAIGGDLDPSLQEARWIPLKQLPSLPMPAANDTVVRRLTA